MSKALYAIYRPMDRNSRMPFPEAHHKAWERELVGLLGGLTLLPVGRGLWKPHKNSSLQFDEPMQQVNILCDEYQLRRIVRYTMHHYDQLAVFVFKLADEVAITTRKELGLADINVAPSLYP